MTEIGQMTSNLVVILLVIGGVAFAARRFAPFLKTRHRPGNPLQHISTLALTPHCSIALVRAGQDDLLLGLTAQSLTLLTKTSPTSPSRLHYEEEPACSLPSGRVRRSRKRALRLRPYTSHCKLSSFPKRRG